MNERFKGSYDSAKTVSVSTGRFRAFMSHIADNNLWEELDKHLTGLGITELNISVGPIYAIQDYLEKAAAGTATPEEDPVIFSEH
jgi:hypothetical protein